MLIGDFMKISGFENIISIEKFEYCGTANEHESCHFVCYAKEKEAKSFLKVADTDCTFEDEKFSFQGHITQISVSRDISGAKIEAFATGMTYYYDQDFHNRIFQNEEKTLSDILSKLESMSDIKHKSKQEKVIKPIVIQDGKTDWLFVKELALLLGENIFTGETVYIGHHGAKKIELTEEECIDYRYSITVHGRTLFCRIQHNLYLGDVVSFNSKDFFVCKKKYILENQQYYFEYFLNEIQRSAKTISVNNDAFLTAAVKDNNDPERKGRVKVSFASEEMEDCMEDSAPWLERECFFSTKEFGAAFIPANGDRVVVKISKGKGIVMGSLRTEAFNEIVQDQDSKYLVLADKVFIEYKDDCFVINNQQNKISLSKENFAANIGDKVKVKIESGKACIQIDKTAIEIAGDLKATASKYIVEAKSDASITASNINIKGKSGVSIN